MRDLSWEKFLTKEQYVFQYHESIPISTLHWDANAARLGRKLDHQHVESLVLSEADEMLPAPTFARRPDLPDSDMTVIDGVHRMEAKTHEAARRTHTNPRRAVAASAIGMLASKAPSNGKRCHRIWLETSGGAAFLSEG